jgi:hypothetical protein
MSGIDDNALSHLAYSCVNEPDSLDVAIATVSMAIEKMSLREEALLTADIITECHNLLNSVFPNVCMDFKILTFKVWALVAGYAHHSISLNVSSWLALAQTCGVSGLNEITFLTEIFTLSNVNLIKSTIKVLPTPPVDSEFIVSLRKTSKVLDMLSSKIKDEVVEVYEKSKKERAKLPLHINSPYE